MTYILTITAKRKNGKRHIVKRHDSYYMLISHYAKFIDFKRYKVEIYTGNWKLIKQVGLIDLQFM